MDSATLFHIYVCRRNYFRAGDEGEFGDDAKAGVSILTARRWRMRFVVRYSGGQITSGTVSRQARQGAAGGGRTTLIREMRVFPPLAPASE